MCDVLHMCTVVTEETILISFFWFADWVEAIHCDARSVYVHAEVERRQYQRSGQSPWHFLPWSTLDIYIHLQILNKKVPYDLILINNR
jgi:hypothetical protein